MQERIEAVTRPLGPTLVRYEALRLLVFGGATPMTRLGSLLQVHSASVTSAVNRLVCQGHVSRGSAEDRRVVLASNMPAGREAIVVATTALNEDEVVARSTKRRRSTASPSCWSGCGAWGNHLGELARATTEEQESQLARGADSQKHLEEDSALALARLRRAADNVFAVLMDAARVCLFGQITDAFFEVGGQYRRNV